MKHIAAGLFFLMFIGLQGYSQKIWTLEDCIAYALDNNIQVKQQQLNIDLAKSNLTQSKASLLPSLNASATHVYNYGRTVDPYTNEFASENIQSNNFNLSSRVTLFNGFQLLNTVKQNQLNLKAAQYDSEKFKDDISLNIATAYLQVLFSMELADAAQNQLDISLQQADRTKKLVEAGTQAKGSLLNIEAQAATDELQLVNARNQLTLAYLTLSQILDLSSPQGFIIEKPSVEVDDSPAMLLNPENIYNVAVSKQPGIKSAEVKLESAMKGLSVARGSMSPNITLSGTYATGYSGASKEIIGYQVAGMQNIGYTMLGDSVYSPLITAEYQTKSFEDQINDNLNHSIGAYLTIPIFSGLQSRSTVNRAKIGILNAELSLQQAKNDLNKTIQQAYADAAAALSKYKASEKSVDALKEAFNFAEQKFNVGMSTFIDYNDAKNKLAKAESDLLQAKYEYVFRKQILNFYLGNPLELK